MWCTMVTVPKNTYSRIRENVGLLRCWITEVPLYHSETGLTVQEKPVVLLIFMSIRLQKTEIPFMYTVT